MTDPKNEPGRPTSPTGRDAKSRVRISEEHSEKLDELIEKHSFLTNKTQAVAYIIDRFFADEDKKPSKKPDCQPIEDDTGDMSNDLLGAFLAA